MMLAVFITLACVCWVGLIYYMLGWAYLLLGSAHSLLGWACFLYVGMGPFIIWSDQFVICWVGPIHVFGLGPFIGLWYFGKLTKLCAYNLWFKHFQILPVPRGRARIDCTTSPYDFRCNNHFTLMFLILLYYDGFETHDV